MCNRKGANDNGHMAEEPRAWKARTRGSEAEVDGVIRPSTVTITQAAANRRFSRDSHTCITWCPINVEPSMRGSVAWKSKAAESPQPTGSSICRSSPQEAFAERGHPPPRNSVECGKNYYKNSSTLHHLTWFLY